jgi:UDP-N-acetylmuramoylalanine--D-glutamate ligase
LHNAANALAAMALTRAVGVPHAPIIGALREFGGLPHRTQFSGEIGGVKFYDDSKGTNVGSTVAALNGMAQQVVLIAGGDGKGQDFSPLRDPIRAKARAVVLIGRDAARIETMLEGSGVPVVNAKTMQEAVSAARKAAQPGDAVLLSPACASLDMFDNYKHRGRVFAESVEALMRREAH